MKAALSPKASISKQKRKFPDPDIKLLSSGKKRSRSPKIEKQTINDEGKSEESLNFAETSPIWKKYINGTNAELQKIRFCKTMIDAYEREGWRSANLEKMRPVQELEKAQARIITSKKKIKSLLQELCDGPEARKERTIQIQEEDSDSGVDASEILCSKCGKGNSTDENDIVMCDLEGCNKAFHQKCCMPEVSQHELEASDDWFCRRCLCKLNILNAINDEFDTDYETWKHLFKKDFKEYETEQKKQEEGNKNFRGAWDTHSFNSDTDEESWSEGIENEHAESSSEESLEDIDENPLILTTKRVRKKVDYSKLNDELFKDEKSADDDDSNQGEGNDEYTENNSNLIESATLKSVFGQSKTKKRTKKERI